MRIALVAPLVERVPPLRYGGTERIIASLADGLCARGHQVTLFGTGDSRTSAELVPAVEHAIWHDLDFDGDPAWAVAGQMGEVFERQHDFDLIHNHNDFNMFPMLYGLTTVAVTTLHGRLDQPVYRRMLSHYRTAPLISISDSQRHGVEDLGLNWISTVHHGLRAAGRRFSDAPGKYLVFLGRISPEKGPDAAIRVAQQAGLPIKIAAKIPSVNHDYFDRAIRPLLTDPLVEFIGEVDEAQKDLLLSEARALLFPADWPEPFGLALIEAMANGTPVVALRRGAVPEIVADGATGFLCDSVGEMPDACARLDQISRAACRARFDAEFTIDRMVDRYEAAYARALAGAPSGGPGAIS
jgi:glycosyltransferase involved in cell wall biosynthesis